MKIRNGFVSNSSSSSFVIAGILRPSIELTNEKKKHIQSNGKFTLLEGNDDGMPDGKYILGKIIAEVDSDDGNISEAMYEISDLHDIEKEVQELLGTEDKIKIISGTRSC